MKKLFYIILAIIIIASLVFIVVKSQKHDAKLVPAGTTKGKSLEEVGNTENANAVENTTKAEDTTNVSIKDEKIEEKNTSDYVMTELPDGVLYSKDGKQIEADISIDDNYFDTTINDIWTNPNSYKGKTIQIEGMYLENLPYTFVGRYAESSVCPNCPPGYSYFEYQLDGNIGRKFTDEKEWIKVVGTLETGNDETTGYNDFYYLKVLTLEVMNKMGKVTVNN